ncbi:hypothetical protein [Fundidesulfovibrio magnetotacticus]|uniref:hypothetical protein n=1 Tax=Fundidesulfovibrio magnetotacticus TaxID=2730080 RepID=UPI001567A3C6|nr:hypothetical protein [Fundidesulfovibrio magnetotacticus]
MGRRILAYVATFAVFALAGAFENIRISWQIGLFFFGLIASVILSVVVFYLVGFIVSPTGNRFVRLGMLASEAACAAVVLRLMLPMAPVH